MYAESAAALRHPELAPGLTLAMVAGQPTKGLSYEAVSALLESGTLWGISPKHEQTTLGKHARTFFVPNNQSCMVAKNS